MLTENEARNILIEANKHIDWLNLGGICSQLGDQGFNWFKFNNQLWRWDYAKALVESKYLKDNAEKINEAIQFLYDNRNDA